MGARRDKGAVWGVGAVACLGTVLAVWLGHPDATGEAIIGRSGALTTLLVALFVTVGGAVFSYVTTNRTNWLRRPLALLIGVVGLVVVVLAAGSLLAPQHGTDFTLGVLLLAGAIAMVIVALQVGRSGSSGVAGR